MSDFSKDNLFTKLKKDKFFKPFDLIIYAVILLIAISSVLVLASINKNANDKGFELLKNGRQVLVYRYGKGVDINDDFVDNITITDNTITVNIDGEYNVLQINDSEKWVQVVDANCKTHDCITAGKLKSSGVILCMHNNVKIIPLSNDDGIVVGGLL